MKIPMITTKFRDPSLNLFKYSKQGILMTYNKRIINLSESILEDKDNVLDFLYSLLDNDLPRQQIDDIKEVIKELLE